MAPEDNLNQDYFIKKSKDKWGNKYDYSLVEYVNCKTKVKIIYNKTGEIYEQSPSNHLMNSPEKIKLAVRKTTEQFIRESNIVHDNKFKYDKTDYIKNNIKVIITCPIHGDFLQNPLSHVLGNGCSNCNESRGEKEITRFLNKYDINYERQHKFTDCKNIFQLPFDFYIPSKRTCIEFDGVQHYQPVEHFGGLKAYESIKINDKRKEEYGEENYIKLIRIRYDQFDEIHQILWNNFKS
jgi:very-short-patch-repair endonuclease